MAKKKKDEGSPEEEQSATEAVAEEQPVGDVDGGAKERTMVLGPNGTEGIIVDKDLFARMVFAVRRGHGDLFARGAGTSKFGAMLGGKTHSENEILIAELELPVTP